MISHRTIESTQPIDVVLALGCGLEQSGELKPGSISRALRAVAISEEHPNARVVFSGSHPTGTLRDITRSEASQMQKLATANGLDAKKSYLETMSTSSFTNLYHCRGFLTENDRRIAVLTDPFALKRVEFFAGYILHGLDFSVIGVESSDTKPMRARMKETTLLSLAKTCFRNVKPGEDLRVVAEAYSRYSSIVSGPKKLIAGTVSE